MSNSGFKHFKLGPPAEIVCPHCLEEFPLGDMLFTGASGEVRKAKRSLIDWLLHRLPQYPLDSNDRPLRDKQCPHCKQALPWTTGEQSDLIIGMVGASYSGKSHYIASLVKRLQKEVSRDFEASLIPVDDATKIRYREEFYIPLYENNLELPFTQPGAKPLIYNFTVDASLSKKGRTNRSVTLVFYDTAGEDFANVKAIERFVKYLSHASGLIFLIDPLQSQVVREMVGKAAKLPVIYSDGSSHEILGTVIGHLNKYGVVTTNQKLNIPVAIVFTKCDVLREMDLIDKHRLWQKDVHHHHSYDLTLHNDINGLFSRYLEEWSPESHYTLRTHFRNYAIFGVSATGCASDENGRFAKISPWRVEDPLLWLLYKLEVIPGKGKTDER
jgi:hypothetical protein